LEGVRKAIASGDSSCLVHDIHTRGRWTPR
jgi:hypothetical protein